MPVIESARARAYELGGSVVVGLSTQFLGARQIQVWRAYAAPGSCTVPHRHDGEEVIVVLSGRGLAWEEGREVRFGPGDTLIFPAGVTHRVTWTAEIPGEHIVSMPVGARHFTAAGEEMALPWT